MAKADPIASDPPPDGPAQNKPAQNQPAQNKPAAGKTAVYLAGSLITVIVAALVTWAITDGGNSAGGVKVALICAIVAFAINWIAFVPSYLARTEHYYDLTGSATYITVTVLALVLSDDIDARSVLIAVLIGLWALRLGSFLFARVRADGKDGRFDTIKQDWALFFRTWSLQGLWVTVTLAAAVAAITSGHKADFGVLAIIGTLVWVVGFGFETVADQQKSAFRSDPANDGRFITSGVWAWSRHPNYFGEITLWLGIAIIAIPAFHGWQWVGLISPVFVTALLTKISGLPLLERRSDRRWGGEAAYEEYKAKTPVLVPRPPR